MLNIISCAFWSFVYHWGNIYSGPLYIKNLGLAPTSSRLWTPPLSHSQVSPPFFSPDSRALSCPGAATGKPKTTASCGRVAVGAASARRSPSCPQKKLFRLLLSAERQVPVRRSRGAVLPGPARAHWPARPVALAAT